MKLHKIKGEKGYDKLSHLPFNRPFKLRMNLVESMKKHGFIVPIVIIVTDVIDGVLRKYILDGQHRAMAAQYLNIDFYAVELDIKITSLAQVVGLVAKYNNSSIAWNLDNYVNAYSSLNNEHYKTLSSIHSKYGYTTSSIACLLEGNMSKSGSTAENIKQGTFIIKAKETTLETLNLVRQTKRMSARMLFAFHKLRLTKDNFKFEVFKKNFEANYTLIKSESYDDYYNVFLTLVD